MEQGGMPLLLVVELAGPAGSESCFQCPRVRVRSRRSWGGPDSKTLVQEASSAFSQSRAWARRFVLAAASGGGSSLPRPVAVRSRFTSIGLLYGRGDSASAPASPAAPAGRGEGRCVSPRGERTRQRDHPSRMLRCALRSDDTNAFSERRPGGAGIPRQNLDR